MKAMTGIWSCILALFLSVFLAQPAGAATQAPPDWPIPGGHFYTQSAGGQGGFSVVDDSTAKFWTEFNRLGGLDNVGYPISRRFTYDGFTTQAFQKLVLQWRPESNQAWPLNVFDELTRTGYDPVLRNIYQTPYPLENFDSPGATWMQIVRARQGLLDASPAIRARYFAARDPLNVYGLPVSRVEDMGNHYAIRTQRAVFQQWKEEVPWARQGQVTIANGGDLAKQLGWLSGVALRPEPLPGTQAGQWVVSTLLVGVGEPGPLWALQRKEYTSPPQYRVMVSSDYGATWSHFAGGLPVASTCLNGLNLDYATPNGLYASTCDGIFRWDGGMWLKLSSLVATQVVVEYRNPSKLWAITGGSNGPVVHSEDGGQRWRSASDGLNHVSGIVNLGLDPRDNEPLYAITSPGEAGSSLQRGTPDGQWKSMLVPGNKDGSIATGMAIDGQSGALYVTRHTDSTLWRSPNPDAVDLADVRWERVHSFDRGQAVRLLAAGWSPYGLALYANLSPKDGSNVASGLYRSLDGGHTWAPVEIP